MSKIHNWALRKYVAAKTRDEEGQGLAEYGLILALIAVVCIAAVTLLGRNASSKFSNVGSSIS